MRIFISADIEGVAAVARYEHSSTQGREYAAARERMTREVNAAIQGAAAAGATEFLVADAHNVGLNLLPELLDERAELIMGSPRPLSMMEGVQTRPDAAIFVGYHGMAGTPDATIPHIFHGRVSSLHLNGKCVGELGLNALIAGHFGVPVAMVAGDRAACAEAKGLLPQALTAAVKQGIGSYAARCMHPRRAESLIRETAQLALDSVNELEPLVLDGPIYVEVRFTTASGADRAQIVPRSKRQNGKCVAYEADDMIEAFRAFHAMAELCEGTHFI